MDIQSAKNLTINQVQQHKIAAPLTADNNAPQGAGLFGEDGLSFGDVLDAVNPLQQLPVVSSVYRAASGSGISAFSRMVGGFLIGGPVGLAVAAANAAVEAGTGKDIGETIMAGLTGEDVPVEAESAAAPGAQAEAGPASALPPSLAALTDIAASPINPLHALIDKKGSYRMPADQQHQMAQNNVSAVASNLVSIKS
jgi:hypothetical protein